MQITRKQVSVPQPPPPPQVEERIVLEMSRDEEKTLVSIIGKVGGTGKGRAFVDSTFRALEGIGICSDHSNPTGSLNLR